MGHPAKSYLLAKLSCIAVAAIFAIAVAYVWLLPIFFNGLKTYSILIFGASGAAAVGGYNTYKSCEGEVGKINKIMLPAFAGLVVAAVVIYFSLLIVVNMRGS